jgi:hypothetical protein
MFPVQTKSTFFIPLPIIVNVSNEAGLPVQKQADGGLCVQPSHASALKMISGQFLQISLPGKGSPGRVMELEPEC